MNEVVVIHAKPGETLSGIAVRYGVSVEALQRWNGIDDPDLVLVGQRIVVYTAGHSPGSLASESAATQAAPGLDGLGGHLGTWMGVAVVFWILLLLFRRKRSTATRIFRTPLPSRRRPGTLAGKAYVTDGDGIRVSGREVRFAGLDAPEWDQVAKHRDGYWFGHGKRVKSTLIQEIGGKQVHVTVEDYDKFGRAVGVVACDGRDVGEWLVREGHAIAAYSNRYRRVEREARKAKRGMWDHAVNIDPRRWRHRKLSRN